MRRARAVFAAALAVFVWRNGRTLSNLFLPTTSLPAEYFIAGDAHSQCGLIKDTVSHKLAYCEDIAHWKGFAGVTNRLIISCDPSRKKWNTVMGPLADPNNRGSLWVYAPNSKQQLAELIIDGYPDNADFHPLGVDTFPGSSPSDPSQILVVNHGRHNSTIELFQLSQYPPYRATYVSTFTHPGFVSPNAVEFTSQSSFYVTQDHRFTRRLPGIIGHTLPVMESTLLPGLSWVDHVDIGLDGQLHINRVADGISFSNGISIRPDGKKVAVASSSRATVNLYKRTSGNELEYEESVLLPFAVDNVGYEVDGTLTAAGHPDFRALVNVASSRREHAPSWVVSIIPRTAPFNASSAEMAMDDIDSPYPVSRKVPLSYTHQVKTLYQSNGSAFSSSTTGIWDGTSKTLYVAGLYQEGILQCRG